MKKTTMCSERQAPSFPNNLSPGVLGMVKVAASRSRSKFVNWQEAWKGLVVIKLMYGCGLFQNECTDLEMKHN